MSHFLAVVDESPKARAHCVARAGRQLEELGLPIASFDTSDVAAVWASPWGRPANCWQASDTVALLFGQALDGAPRSLSAREVAQAWAAAPGAIPAPFDGLYGALVWRRPGRLLVGADILGRFPVYYYRVGGALLVASSPELFRCHAGWCGRLDLEGLAGLLTANYLLDGRTLWAGARRLGAGNLLIWEGGEAREQAQYRIPVSDRYFGLDFEAHAELAASSLDQAIARHMPGGPRYEMLFSGGLDSRMLGGFLRQRCLRPKAITWGDSGDLEMHCARKVVKALRLEHETQPVDEASYPEFAQREVQWRSLANGFNAVFCWQQRQTPPASGGFTSGQAMDIVIGGGIVVQQSQTDPEGRVRFEHLFARDNRWGIPAPVLRQLLRPERFSDAIDRSIERMRQDFEACGGEDFQKAWAYTILHRHRFHTSPVLGLHGLWGWPVLPTTDRKVLEVMSGIPLGSMLRRRLQEHLVITRFPDLARLPLDRNAYDIRPLIPLRSSWGKQRLLSLHSTLQHWLPRRQRERRFYYRVLDFNGPGWRAIRQQAEPGRKLLEPLFNLDVLARLVPPPTQPLMAEDAIIDTSGAKLLAGLMLWAQGRL
ncbi:MAG TPA: asparagine synthase-related protein [Verrucomicrobiota bacterium]|nr:asparagine synthase-related protein [Verrucomicrobiota bacterium]